MRVWPTISLEKILKVSHTEDKEYNTLILFHTAYLHPLGMLIFR